MTLRQLPYQDDIVYGLILSRRLGWSLGINLCSTTTKLCSFDCIYCQFPKSQPREPGTRESSRIPRIPQLIELIEVGIRKRLADGVFFDSITLAGNGDPSLHPDLLKVSLFLKTFIWKLRMKCSLSIFTNAMPYKSDRFRRALELYDRRLIKLDASDEPTVSMIDRPCAIFNSDHLCESIGTLGGVIIQSMVIKGRVDNRSSLLRPRFNELVAKAHATEVQLCTIDKQTCICWCHAAERDGIERICATASRKSN